MDHVPVRYSVLLSFCSVQLHTTTGVFVNESYTGLILIQRHAVVVVVDHWRDMPRFDDALYCAAHVCQEALVVVIQMNDDDHHDDGDEPLFHSIILRVRSATTVMQIRHH
jgi:hypothetical protein